MEFRIIFMEQVPIPDVNPAQDRELTKHVKESTELAHKRRELEQDTRHRFLDLDTKKKGKLNRLLENWWALSDYQAFLAAIKSAFGASVPVKERQGWEEYFVQQQTTHKILTAQIVQREKAINTLVYQIYGLSAAEISLIEQAVSYNFGG